MTSAKFVEMKDYAGSRLTAYAVLGTMKIPLTLALSPGVPEVRGDRHSMNDHAIRITGADAAAEREDRFHRFKLIGWWDQRKLAAARVLVIGAGALGNEIVKNLALLGIGRVLIADMDRIENSNLSRSVLYREADNGQPKAIVAARGAREIYPEMKAHAFHGNVVYDLGAGVFRWADVVIGGLDNREARLAINRACWRVRRPWIDGAIEQIQGVARVFSPVAQPQGPCYECTMSATDWKLLQMRRSCNLLSRADMQQGGKTPTTPTIGSIIAGVQCQEAVKLLHGLETIAGRGWVFTGMSTDAYTIEYQPKADCYSHDTLDEIVPLDGGVANVTARELLVLARQRLGGSAELELGREMLEKLVCPTCGREESLFISLGKAGEELAECPHCGTGTRRDVVTFFKIRGDQSFLDQPLAEIGVPAFDIVIARGGGRSIGFELTGDAPAVLGELWEGDAGLQWV
jgi:sulfur-carrier protein adenylyltransferase/sulfurtransferase